MCSREQSDNRQPAFEIAHDHFNGKGANDQCRHAPGGFNIAIHVFFISFAYIVMRIFQCNDDYDAGHDSQSYGYHNIVPGPIMMGMAMAPTRCCDSPRSAAIAELPSKHEAQRDQQENDPAEYIKRCELSLQNITE